jgi:hypothetical protein
MAPWYRRRLNGGCVWPTDNGLRHEQSPLHNMAQFAHREGIRYSMSGRSPDSRTPMAGECLPTPLRAQ